jgi:hypothetical protein
MIVDSTEKEFVGLQTLSNYICTRNKNNSHRTTLIWSDFRYTYVQQKLSEPVTNNT